MSKFKVGDFVRVVENVPTTQDVWGCLGVVLTVPPSPSGIFYSVRLEIGRESLLTELELEVGLDGLERILEKLC